MIDLNSVLEMWEQDCKIDGMKLDDVSRDTPNLHAKYLRMLTEAKLQLKRAEFKQKTLLKEKWLWYENKMSKEDIDEKGWQYDPYDGLNIRTKQEKEFYYDSDLDIQKSEELLHYWKTVIDTLEDIINNIRWRHSTIKNMIDWRKFESGN